MFKVVRAAPAVFVFSLALGLPCGRVQASDPIDARIRALDRRIAHAPADKQLYARRAGLLCEQGDARAAEADLLEIRRIDAGWADLDLVAARCSLEQGRLDEAQASIAKFRARRPDDVEGWGVEAEILLRLGRWQDAERQYLQYLSLVKRPDPEAYLHASEAMEGQGSDHLEAAARVVVWGLSNLGNVPELHERGIRLALASGDPEGALRRIEEAISTKRKGPRHDERWLALRGDVLSTLGRVDEARTAYRAALTTIDRQSAARRQDPAIMDLRASVEAKLAQNDGGS